VLIPLSTNYCKQYPGQDDDGQLLNLRHKMYLIVCSFAHSLTYSLTHSLTHSLPHSLIYSLVCNRWKKQNESETVRHGPPRSRQNLRRILAPGMYQMIINCLAVQSAGVLCCMLRPAYSLL